VAGGAWSPLRWRSLHSPAFSTEGVPVKLQPAPSIPSALRQPVTQKSVDPPVLPGVIVGLDGLMASNPALAVSLLSLRRQHGLSGESCLVIPPEGVSWMFSHTDELGLLKTLVVDLIHASHPILKSVVEGIWIGFGAAKLCHDWTRPNRDTGDCLIGA
jgi:hypothetical protein